ncbi:type II secretion system protein GspC [Pseudomonadota bacterium]
MVTMAKGGWPILPFNLRKILNHRMTVLCITAVLAFYILWQAGSLVWKLWLLTDESPQPGVLLPMSTRSAQPESLQNLQRYPLIQSASIATAQDSASTDAPKTSLNLKLVGLMYSTDKNQARAIIESEEDGARSFAIRERVAENAEIYRIESDRVILMHAGRQEALMLDPEQKSSSVQADAGNQPINSPNRSQAATKSPDRSQASTASQAASRKYSASVPKSTADLMRDFSATPVMEKGELQGFRLKALRDPKIMKEWGIDPNDVITAVNGIELNAPGRVMVLYDKLKKQREFEVTLSNGGNSRTITRHADPVFWWCP